MNRGPALLLVGLEIPKQNNLAAAAKKNSQQECRTEPEADLAVH
jgi:hypothetical protein